MTNKADESVGLRLTVEQAGTTLYSQHHTVPSNAMDRVIAGFTRETLPPEMQEVDVTVETDGGQADRINFKVNSCHGDIQIETDEFGDVRMFYSVC